MEQIQNKKKDAQDANANVDVPESNKNKGANNKPNGKDKELLDKTLTKEEMKAEVEMVVAALMKNKNGKKEEGIGKEKHVARNDAEKGIGPESPNTNAQEKEIIDPVGKEIALAALQAVEKLEKQEKEALDTIDAKQVQETEGNVKVTDDETRTDVDQTGKDLALAELQAAKDKEKSINQTVENAKSNNEYEIAEGVHEKPEAESGDDSAGKEMALAALNAVKEKNSMDNEPTDSLESIDNEAEENIGEKEESEIGDDNVGRDIALAALKAVKDKEELIDEISKASKNDTTNDISESMGGKLEQQVGNDDYVGTDIASEGNFEMEENPPVANKTMDNTANLQKNETKTNDEVSSERVEIETDERDNGETYQAVEQVNKENENTTVPIDSKAIMIGGETDAPEMEEINNNNTSTTTTYDANVVSTTSINNISSSVSGLDERIDETDSPEIDDIESKDDTDNISTMTTNVAKHVSTISMTNISSTVSGLDKRIDKTDSPEINDIESKDDNDSVSTMTTNAVKDVSTISMTNISTMVSGLEDSIDETDSPEIDDIESKDDNDNISTMTTNAVKDVSTISMTNISTTVSGLEDSIDERDAPEIDDIESKVNKNNISTTTTNAAKDVSMISMTNIGTTVSGLEDDKDPQDVMNKTTKKIDDRKEPTTASEPNDQPIL